MKRCLIALLILCLSSINAQSTAHSSSEIYHDLLRLQNNASVMYLAAHPDDENTKIISWLTNEQLVDAVYLSLTRGDGGQNLIGNEIGDMLGLLRTQELLEARKIDKGRQWFTRAVDFGYSKTAEETFEHWDQQEILADVVWAIRRNQPEVIITRFSPDSNGQTHGHHTASAILAMQAFDLAADKNAFPEQLQYVDTWQVKRMFYNTSWWFYGSKERFEQVDKSDMITVDVGTYFPLLGTSNNEISAKSRSQHACQGFGAALERGSQTEYLQFIKGDQPKTNDIFEGIHLGWEIPEIQDKIQKLIANYDFVYPENSTADLVELYQLGVKYQINDYQLNQIKDLILSTHGIYFEFTTELAFGRIFQTVPVRLEVSNRAQKFLKLNTFGEDFKVDSNQTFEEYFDFTLDPSEFYSPYWLQENPKNALHQIPDPMLIGLPETPNLMEIPLRFNFDGVVIEYKAPLLQKFVNPAVGEVYENFYAVPDFVINFPQENYIFNNSEKNVEVEVISFLPDVKVDIELIADGDWEISDNQSFISGPSGKSRKFYFQINPLKNAKSTKLKARIVREDAVFSKSMNIVDYEHIQRQIHLKEAEVNLKNLDLNLPQIKLAYIQGSGDEIPNNLRDIGLSVDELDTQNWNSHRLKNYDVIMLGIRAYNTLDRIPFIQNDLFDFIENGGVVVVQYNTNRDLLVDQIAPIPIVLGRERISEENAFLKILDPKHPVFNYPNKINHNDFENWVQERGLYFASHWNAEFTPLLEGNDRNESPTQGILLVSDYGKGKFVYTGISFFRQLPAGVPGAYRLLMNVLALGEN